MKTLYLDAKCFLLFIDSYIDLVIPNTVDAKKKKKKKKRNKTKQKTNYLENDAVDLIFYQKKKI